MGSTTARRRPSTGMVTCGVLALCLGLSWPAVVRGAPTQSTDIAAPYVHVPVAIAGATGPLSTLFIIRSTATTPVPGGSGESVDVLVTCFNDHSQPVGSPVGVSVAINQSFVYTPDGGGFTTSPSFTGAGWCYFARIQGGTFAVEVVWGIYGGPPGAPRFDGLPDFTPLRMLSSNASRAVAAATGQTSVAGGPSTGVGNLPHWAGGNWLDALILVNPTASAATVAVDVFRCAGCNPVPAVTTLTVPLAPRGMAFVILSNFVGGSIFDGNATIRSGSTCCFMAWNWAVNVFTFQAVFHDVPLDVIGSRVLGLADRP